MNKKYSPGLLRSPSALTRAIIAVAASAALLASLLSARAASVTWDGGDSSANTTYGGSGTWDTNTTTDWTVAGPTEVNWTDTTGVNTAVFTGNAGTVTLAGTEVANKLLFLGTAGYVLTGGTINLKGSAPTITGTTGATETINSVLNGASVTMAQDAASSLVLNGANTVTGATTITGGGTVTAGNTQAFGLSSATIALNGGTLDLATDTSITAYNMTVGGNATIASDRATASSAGITQTLGTLSIGADTLNVTAGPNVSGGSPAVAFGAVTLTGATTATFDAISASVTLASVSGAAKVLTLGGSVAGNSVGAITTGTTVTINGGTWTLTGANTSNLTNINANTTVIAANSAAFGSSTSGTPVVISGNNAALDLATDTSIMAYNVSMSVGSAETATIASDRATLGAGITQTLGTLILSNYTLNVIAGPNVSGGSPVVAFGATVFGTATLNPTTASVVLASGSFSSNKFLTLEGSAIGNSIGPITSTGAANIGNIIVSASNGGIWTLTGANSYTGSTAVNGGTLDITGAGTLGATTDALTVSGGTLDLGTTSQTVGAVTISGAGTIQDGNLTGASYTGTNNAGITATVSANLQGSGTFSKLGAGTVILSGNNSYTGSTNVSAGILIISGNSTCTGTTTLTAGTLVAGNVNAFGASTAPLVLTTGTLDLATDTSITAYNTTVGGSITIASDKATASSAGITQTLGTLLIGTQTLNVIAGPNVNGGSPVVAFGAVSLVGNATFNPTTASLTVASVTETGTRTMTLAGSAAGNSVGPFTTGNGSLTVSASNGGVWTETGASTYGGATTVNGGTLIVNGSITGSTVTVNAGGALEGIGTMAPTTSSGTSVTISGTLAPATVGTIGTITFTLAGTAKLDFASASTLKFDINSGSADEVAFTSAPASGSWLAGSGNATLALNGTINYADTYTIFHNASASASAFTFAAITGYDTTDYNAVVAQSGDDYDLSFVAVPEPATWASLLSAFGLLVSLQKSRRRTRLGS